LREAVHGEDDQRDPDQAEPGQPGGRHRLVEDQDPAAELQDRRDVLQESRCPTSGTRLAAPANSSSGTAVATPESTHQRGVPAERARTAAPAGEVSQVR
jgi:hypothetical protein